MDRRFTELAERLQQHPGRALNLPGLELRDSAVLVPFVVRGEAPALLFTLRPAHLRRHAGQVSFPGGVRDAADATLLHTALRELREELGVPAGSVEVLGMLDEIPTTSEFRVVPYVGVLDPAVPLRPDAGEIAELLEIPARPAPESGRATDGETPLPGSRARRVLLRRGSAHHLGGHRPDPQEPPRGAGGASRLGKGRAGMTLYPVVIAGGSGTRFWLLWRKARPKQFLSLATRKPLLVETVARLGSLAVPGRTYVVCGPLHAKGVRRLLPRLPTANVVVEPVARNTAPAIGLATLHVQARDPDAILVVLPADHHVADVAAFQRVLRRAAEVARAGSLVTVGIRPTRPETGYGYVQLGEPIDASAFRVRAFVEKPDAPTAARYLASGDYLWNGGIFVFTARAMREAIDRHLPELGKVLAALEPTVGTRRHAAALKRLFPRAPSVSIDYGVMEKARDIAVVPGDFGWSDVGSFAALPEVRPADAAGNVVMGEGAILVDSTGCVVVGSGRPLGVVGLQQMVVVDSGDAVLVVPRERSQDVRAVVQSLRSRGFKKFE